MNQTEYENFKQYYWIDTGEDNIMYTLKNARVDWMFYDGVQKPYVRHFYVKNLSIDYAEAVEKAREYVEFIDKPLHLEGEKETNEWGSGSNNNYVAEMTEEQKKFFEEKRLAEEATAKQEKEAYEKAEPVPVTTERVKFEGVVLGTKNVETQWGNTSKCLFQDDRGFKLWGSCVASKGEKVSFVARVNPSEDDSKFGFFSRPTKILLEGEDERDNKKVYVDIQGWKEMEFASDLKVLYKALNSEYNDIIKNGSGITPKGLFIIQNGNSHTSGFSKPYKFPKENIDKIKKLIEDKLGKDYLNS